jgi:hypothetical protein
MTYTASGNNVDIAISTMRELQEMIFDNTIANMELFKKTEEIMKYMQKGSVEIKTNYADISTKLTEELNSGRLQIPLDEIPVGKKLKD